MMSKTRMSFVFFVLVGLAVSAFAGSLASGEIDTSFGINGRVVTEIGHAKNWATGVAVQGDGKLVVVGGSASGEVGVVRYKPDGSLDPTFGATGWVTTDINASYDEAPTDVAIQADGKIVVSAEKYGDVVLLRYSSTGVLDPSFSGDGKVDTNFGTTNDQINAITIQSDGKILVAGFRDEDFAVARFTTDGSFDASFGGSGVSVVNFGVPTADARDIALQSDGKIIVVGRFENDIAMARLLTDGSIDTSFGGGGQVVTDCFGGWDYGRSVQINGSGQILVGGFTTHPSSGILFALLRYSTGGVLDTDFGVDGVATSDVGPTDDYGHALGVQSDGKILLAGDTFNTFAIARFTADGQIDTSFGSNGSTVVDLGSGFAIAAAVLGDDRFVLVGGFEDDVTVLGFTAEGSLDSGFGMGGQVITDFGNSWDYGKAVAVMPYGRILVGGYAKSIGANDSFAVACYLPDGTLDNSFGGDGIVITHGPGGDIRITDILLPSDGKILAVGNNESYGYALARYYSDGTPDTSFGNGGTVISGAGGGCKAAALQPDGKIVITGSIDGTYSSDIMVRRFFPNGAIDSGFGTNGLVTTDIGQSSNHAWGITVQADGKILVAAYRYLILRYLANGELDSSFGVNGVAGAEITTGDYALDVAVQTDHKIIVVGTDYGSSDLVVARFLPDGALDTSYGSGGTVVESGSGENIELQHDGKAIVGGNFRAVRLTMDGALDTSFGSGGWVSVGFYGHSPNGEAMCLQPDEDIVMAGHVFTPGVSPDFALTRIEGDRSVLFVNDFEERSTAIWSVTVGDLAGNFDQLLIHRNIFGDYSSCSYNDSTGEFSYLGQVFHESDGGLSGLPIVDLHDLYWKNEEIASTIAPYSDQDPDLDLVPSSSDADCFLDSVQ